MYEFVGVFGAGTLVGFMEETFFGKWINPTATSLVNLIFPWPWAREFLVGPYGTITMALTYALALILPIVTTFFLFFGFLEDSGYLPRLAVMMDRIFRLMGLNGRAVLPMVLGLGCDTMATVTTRILDTRKEKIIVSLLLTLSVPCSAQLAAILGMSAGVSGRVLLLWLAVIGAVTILVGWGASRILPGARSPFLVEIPPLRIPKISNIFKKVRARLKWYSKEVIPLFVLATAVLYFMDKFHLLRILERVFSPVVVDVLGLPLKATEAFIVGFFRRDYGAAGFFHLAQDGFLNARQLLVSMVVITLFMPCVAHVLITLKERGTRATVAIMAFVLSFSIGVGGLLNWVLLKWPIILNG
jgi:ferrous iron transport protein B